MPLHLRNLPQLRRGEAMHDTKEGRGFHGGRRLFLKGLLTGGGLAVALGMTSKKTAAKPTRRGTDPILYRRTADVEKYYQTLYR